MTATCPKCNSEFSSAFMAELLEEYRLQLVINQQPGTFLSAKALSRVISSLDAALQAEARHLGGKVNVLIETLSTEEETITVGLLVAQVREK